MTAGEYPPLHRGFHKCTVFPVEHLWNTVRSRRRCQFWQRDLSVRATGDCRRSSPSIVGDLMLGRFPITNEREWCGEFKPR